MLFIIPPASGSHSSSLSRATPNAPSYTEPLRPSEKVKFLQKMAKGNVEPMELFSRGVKSKGFQVLLKNVEIQHRILEEMPLLAAFDGFRQITGRRLSDEQVRGGAGGQGEDVWSENMEEERGERKLRWWDMTGGLRARGASSCGSTFSSF